MHARDSQPENVTLTFALWKSDWLKKELFDNRRPCTQSVRTPIVEPLKLQV
jgi:hypothetical protein